ncbi:MBL fold metallo-hydrolase [Sulfuricurvum sp.]|uniref:MBL fold metallo-hydrolase n=1 Tax=Sulfuricurvum sp. TaxID=2025608 RepID=UPI002E375D2E|nr:MBL fold metallo-hydrolase [Sulfuricurvum sp.]HEX5328708.1 MBL fold metallo-hydrolase [Sulfuricurvum sp.]
MAIFQTLSHKQKTKPSKLPIIAQENLPSDEYALWLGHATLWLKLAETTVAIDPVLGNLPLYRRYSPLPIPKEKLFADVILITHAHYDHYDKASLLYLLKQNPKTIIVAPNGFWRYLKGKIDRERCFELEWWESVMVGGLFITLVPSLHWSNRTYLDMNKALWGGYVIQNADHSIYHSGDTAYGEHFKEIHERFEIDEAFLPIGAYRPEAIMKKVHISPPEALRAAHDLGAKTLIPIHYGTFKLSDEPVDEPIEWFEHLVSTSTHSFHSRTLRIGEIYRFNPTSTLKST